MIRGAKHVPVSNEGHMRQASSSFLRDIAKRYSNRSLNHGQTIEYEAVG